MIEAIKRLIGPEYLIVSEPGLPAGLWLLYAALGLLFATGIAVAIRVLISRQHEARRLSQGTRAWAWFEFWVCLLGLGTVLGRFLGWPGWSARIWPFFMAILAIAGALAFHLRAWVPPRWLERQLRMLALDPAEPHHTDPSTIRTLLGLAVFLVHFAGITAVVRVRYGLPVWSAPLVLLLLLAPQVPLLAARRPPRVSALAPLLGAYGVVLVWWLYRRWGITVIAWQGLAFPNPFVSLFYVDGIVLASVAHAMLCQLRVSAQILRRPSIRWQWPLSALLALSLGWASVVYFSKRTHGATASDPYAYAQMGVDLAERGTLLHRYALFQQVMPLKIAWAPLQPVGYHIPRNSLGDCPSVWPTGASILLAAGYKLLGEVGLYVATPAVALLALAGTWALVQEVLRDQSRPVRHLSAAIAVTLLATSTEHVDRLLVPMADASAELFTILTLFFALMSARHLATSSRLAFGSLALTGVCFAWAYWVRHTQLVLALPVMVAIVTAPVKRHNWLRLKLLALLLVFGVALAAALPDILYRSRVFGGVFAIESTELPSMSLTHVLPMAWKTLRDLLVAGEWGYLFPLVLYGAFRLATRKPAIALVLGSAVAAVLGVHLAYQFLRLRDLLSLFPLFAIAAAYGAAALHCDVRLLWRERARGMRMGTSPLVVGVLVWILLSLALSRWAMIDRLWKPGWASFGYMRSDQRAAFDRLAELTPPEAVIGASLNAGAVMLYSDRDAIRPYDSWTDMEWNVFLAAMRELRRPVYLLDDGQLMTQFIELEETRRRLQPVEALSVPIFSAPYREFGWLYQLEWAQ